MSVCPDLPWVFATGFFGGMVATLSANYLGKIIRYCVEATPLAGHYRPQAQKTPHPPTVPRHMPPAPPLHQLQEAHSRSQSGGVAQPQKLVKIDIPQAPAL